MRWWALAALIACKAEPQMKCGKGTTLKNGVCEVAEVVVVVADAGLDAATIDAKSTEVGWQYQDKVDQMRGGKVRLAALRSTNAVEFGSPYGESHMVLMLRLGDKASGVPLEAFLGIERGQFECGVNSCMISWKFDDGKVEQKIMSRGSDSSSIFFFVAPVVIEKLKAAKTMMVEAQFFREGKRQFTFDVAGLDFELPTVTPAPSPTQAPKGTAKATPKTVKDYLETMPADGE